MPGLGQRRNAARAALAAGIVAAGLLAATPHASASVSSSGVEGVAVKVLHQDPSDVRDYWTRARMKAAEPAGQTLSAAATGEHQAVRNPRRYPARTHGKVFLTLGGTDYHCSATAVRSPGRSLVWTAGHCLYGPTLLGSGYASNWEFVPAMDGRERPFGEWPATHLATTPQWRASQPGLVGGVLSGLGGDPRFDVGAAVLARKGGKEIQQRIGARGIGFNRSRDRRYRAFGYPADPPPRAFDGRHLFYCDSPYLGPDRGWGRPAPMRIRCDLTGGSSGGGWVSGGDVLSVISYRYQGEPNRLYGPYHGDAARNLYESVKNR